MSDGERDAAERARGAGREAQGVRAPGDGDPVDPDGPDPDPDGPGRGPESEPGAGPEPASGQGPAPTADLDPTAPPAPDGDQDPDPGSVPDSDSAEARRLRRFERRRHAHRGARRRLGRSTLLSSLRDRLAVLDDVGDLYDLDQPVDLYGNGIVAALEEKVAGLLGTEAAAFFPTGTMAQQIALRCWASRTGDRTVALHALAHPEVHERNAFSEVSGLRPVRLTREPRLPTAAEVRDFEEPFGALMLELPLRDAGFVLPTFDELTEIVGAAREREAVVHFDGARLWETTEHFGRPLPEIAGLADSVYVSFYKSLNGLGGAAMAGPEPFVEQARSWRHRYGGLVFQQFPTVLTALAGLERELPRLPEYVRHARVVAAALREGFTAAGLPWFRVHPEVPHTHEFQLWLPHDADLVAEAALRHAEETRTLLFGRSWDAPGPGLAVTEIEVRAEGLEWTPADVRTAVAGFVAILREETAGRG